MGQDDEGAQLHTLGLLEELRSEYSELWGTSSELYHRLDRALRKLANPNLHDIANMSFRVELWDRHANHVRWAVAAAGSVTVAHAAFDAAVQLAARALHAAPGNHAYSRAQPGRCALPVGLMAAISTGP